MGCRPDWCKNRRPSIKCAQTTIAKKVKGALRPLHPQRWQTAEAGEYQGQSCRSLGHYCRRGQRFILHRCPSICPWAKQQWQCHLPDRTQGHGAQIRQAWSCVMRLPLPEEWGTRTEDLREISHSDLSFFIVPENRPEDNSDQQSPQADDTHWQRMQSMEYLSHID